MKKGEIWYVIVNNNTTLMKFKLSDLTEKTVELETLDYFPRSYRYKRDDVEFVERVK